MSGEDDFLDDVLDDFGAAPAAKGPAVLGPTTGDASSGTDAEVAVDDEFARQLAAGMEQLMREMSGATKASASSAETQAAAPTGAESVLDDAAFSKAMADMMSALKIPGSTAAPSQLQSQSSSSSGGGFQSQVSETLTKLRDSSEKVTSQVEDAAATEPGLEEMMAELERLMGGTGGADLDNLLKGVMDQVMTKDMMYGPMKDLSEKYPGWLEANKGKISAEDMARYTSQSVIVQRILAVYDGNQSPDEESKEVMILMQQMQDTGNPPEEIMKELAPDMEMGPDGVPKLPANLFGGEGQPDGKDCAIM